MINYNNRGGGPIIVDWGETVAPTELLAPSPDLYNVISPILKE